MNKDPKTRGLPRFAPMHRRPGTPRAAKLVSAILIAAFAAIEVRAASIEDVGSFRVTIHRRQAFSGIDGYVQVPMGGQPGSATSGRPTFDEIDFNSLLIQSGGLVARRRNHTFSIIGNLATRIDSSKLTTGFISRKEEYFPGDMVRTELKTHVYSFSHRYHLPIRERFGVPVDISIGPSLVVWDFKFRIIGPNGRFGVGGREFSQSNLHFQSEARVRFGKLTMFFETMLPTPVDLHNFAAISFHAGSEYCLLKRQLMIFDLFLGIYYSRIRFEDHQPMPNDILIDFSPTINAGFRIRL